MTTGLNAAIPVNASMEGSDPNIVADQMDFGLDASQNARMLGKTAIIFALGRIGSLL